MKISIKYQVVIEHLTKCWISQSVFNQLTCSWATFEGVIEGHKRPRLQSFEKTGLGLVFFRSWTGLETGPSSTTLSAFSIWRSRLLMADSPCQVMRQGIQCHLAPVGHWKQVLEWIYIVADGWADTNMFFEIYVPVGDKGRCGYAEHLWKFQLWDIDEKRSYQVHGSNKSRE